MKPTFTIGVFGIIPDDNNRVLLCLRNDYDFWNLPGWGMEQGETPRDAMIREAKEETGLEVDITRLIGIYSKPENNEIVFLFACKKIWGQITLNEEARDIQYFSRENIPSNTPPKHTERIKDFLENKNTPIMKIQGGISSKELFKKIG